MTDAYEDMILLQDDKSAAYGDTEGPGDTLGAAGGNSTESDAWHTTLETAEHRRKEFSAWLLHRARHSSGTTQKAAERVAADERKLRRLERLQERLAAAEANRAAGLARLQCRAAATSRRREGAAERAAAAAAERTAAAAERLEAELAAAESRRLALREAELERLRTEHELVLNRLLSSQERAAVGAEKQRSRLEARLLSASNEREARLAWRAARAANKVERARALGAQTREMQQLETESRRQALEQKLETARRRREDRRQKQPSAQQQQPAAAASVAAPVEPSDLITRASSVSSPSHSSQSHSTSTSQSPSPSRSSSLSSSHSPQRDDSISHVTSDITAANTTFQRSAHVAEADSRLEATENGNGNAIVAGVLQQPQVSEGLVLDEAGAETAPDADPWDSGEAATGQQLEGLRRSISSRRVQQVWRAFVKSKRTTRTLAEMFVAQDITNVQLPSKLPPPPLSAAAVAAQDVAARAAGAVDVPPRLASTLVEVGVVRRREASERVRPLSGRGLDTSQCSGVGGTEEYEDSFDRFASALRSPATLKATQALMRRLEQRLAARQTVLPHGKAHGGGGSGRAAGSSHPAQSPGATGVSRLLRRLYPNVPRDAPLERYPPRVLLCAFMIVRHPEVVFSGSGPRESALAAAARDLVERLEALLERIILVPAEPPSPYSDGSRAASAALEPAGPLQVSPTYIAVSPVARGMEELMRQRRTSPAEAVQGSCFKFPPPSPSSTAGSPYMTIGSLLVQLDDAWLRYLDQFVAWKGADAASLETELVRCAAALEVSMLRKCRGDPNSNRVHRSSDLQAVIAQVAHDQSLLRERVGKLGGEAGLARLEAALEAARRAVLAEISEQGSATPSASATASEADTTDAESPSRNSHGRGAPRGGGRGGPTSSLPLATNAFTATAVPSPLEAPRRPSPPTPLALSMDVTSGTAPSQGADSAALPSASAPIPVPPRRPSPPEPGADEEAREDGGKGGGGTSAVPVAAAISPSPLSASPRSPGSLRAAVLGPDGGSGRGGARQTPLPLDAGLVSNAALVHEMLLGASTGSYRLPTAEAEAAWSRAVAAVSLDSSGLSVLAPGPDLEELQAMTHERLIRALRSRTAAIAECAFWDNVAITLAAALQTPPQSRPSAAKPAWRLAAVLAPLLSEVAMEVVAVVNSSQQAAALRAEYSEGAIRLQIQGPVLAIEPDEGPLPVATSATAAGSSSSTAVAGTVAAVHRALAVLQRLAALLVAAGAPAREEEALLAQGTMKQRLVAAVEEYESQQGQFFSGAGLKGHGRVGKGGDMGRDGHWSSGVDDDDDGDDEVVAAAPPPLALALGRSLRLLAAQVKLLKVDAANGRLQALAATLQGDGGVAYLRSKFATIFRLEEPTAADLTVSSSFVQGSAAADALAPPAPTLAAATVASIPPRLQGQALLQMLPRTAAWLSRSRATAAGICTYIRAQGIDLTTAVAAAAAAAHSAGGAPSSLRAGLRMPPGHGAANAAAAPRAGLAVTIPPVVPVGPEGEAAWRWTARWGLVALVSSDSPAVGPALAETLLWDGERLHTAQNQFQQLVVVTAGMLLVTQLRATAVAAARSAAAPDTAAATAAAAISTTAWDPEARTAAARRLLVVVADPAMRLSNLTSELAAMAGVAGDEDAEARLRGAFMSLVDSSSNGFRALTNALAAALLLHITLGPQLPTATTHGSTMGSANHGGARGVAAAAAAALLARVGASGLAADIAALGGQLLALAAVNEAVHGTLYEHIHGHIDLQEAADHLRQQGPQQEPTAQQQSGSTAAATAMPLQTSPPTPPSSQPAAAAQLEPRVAAGVMPHSAKQEAAGIASVDKEEEGLDEGDEI